MENHIISKMSIQASGITEEDILAILSATLGHQSSNDAVLRDRISFISDPSTIRKVEIDPTTYNGQITFSGRQYGIPHTEVVKVEAHDIEGGSHNRAVKRLAFQFGRNGRTYLTIVKESANTALAQIEGGILRALQKQASLYPDTAPSTPAVLYSRDQLIALEDLLGRKFSDRRDVLPAVELFRRFHQEGDYRSAQRLVTTVMDAYRLRIAPTMHNSLEQIAVEHEGRRLTGLEYLRQEKLKDVQKAFPDIDIIELERFYNYFELLLQHKKAPYFSANFRTLAELFSPVKRLDALAPKGEIAKDMNEGNVFVVLDMSRKKLGDAYDVRPSDILFIDFEGFRVINSSHEQSLYWLLFYPEVVNPNESNTFLNGTTGRVISEYAEKRARLEGVDSKVVKERSYLAILKESLKHVAYFDKLGDSKKARYLHEVAIMLTDEMRRQDASIDSLNSFLKQEYKSRYGEEFDGRFSMRLHRRYDPFGTNAVAKFGDVPVLPVSVLADSYRGPKEKAIRRVHATTS